MTWSGGRIRPSEFQEFGISFQVPEEPGMNLVFPAVQTYSNGERVRWIGPEDADQPAPRVTVLEAPPEEAAAEDAAGLLLSGVGGGGGAWRRDRPGPRFAEPSGPRVAAEQGGLRR